MSVYYFSYQEPFNQQSQILPFEMHGALSANGEQPHVDISGCNLALSNLQFSKMVENEVGADFQSSQPVRNPKALGYSRSQE